MTRTVVTHTRHKAIPETPDFNFSPEMIPILDGGKSGALKEYRENAWETYQRLPFPKTTDEPWRRTDLRKLDAGSFLIP